MQKRDGFGGWSVVSGSHQNQKLVVVVVVFFERGGDLSLFLFPCFWRRNSLVSSLFFPQRKSRRRRRSEMYPWVFSSLRSKNTIGGGGKVNGACA